jgi:hypothetical protein
VLHNIARLNIYAKYINTINSKLPILYQQLLLYILLEIVLYCIYQYYENIAMVQFQLPLVYHSLHCLVYHLLAVTVLFESNSLLVLVLTLSATSEPGIWFVVSFIGYVLESNNSLCTVPIHAIAII